MQKTEHVPASPKQVKFVRDLLAERVVEDEHARWVEEQIENDVFSLTQAKAEISALLSKPRKPKAQAPKVEATPGFYCAGKVG